MNSAMNATSAFLGIPLAWGIYQCFRWLRQVALLPVVVVGWLVLIFALVNIGMLTYMYCTMRNKPLMPMGAFWGFLVAVLSAVILLCAGIAVFQRHIYHIDWAQAFGVLMAEAGIVTLLWLALQECISPVADLIRCGKRGISVRDTRTDILDSLQRSRFLLGNCAFTMAVALLLLEALYLPLSK